MRDESFEMFIEGVGEATSSARVPAAAIARYRPHLPDYLLERWADDGWCGYANGLVWTVDPQQFERQVSMWLEGTPLAALDKFHAFARTAFGTLYAWGEHYRNLIVINCAIAVITALRSDFLKPDDSPDLTMRIFFGSGTRKRFDIRDQNGEPMFAEAQKRLGPLKETEIYGFEPALALGGPCLPANLAKLDMDVHLSILRESSPVRVQGW